MEFDALTIQEAERIIQKSKSEHTFGLESQRKVSFLFIILITQNIWNKINGLFIDSEISPSIGGNFFYKQVKELLLESSFSEKLLLYTLAFNWFTGYINIFLCKIWKENSPNKLPILPLALQNY